MSRLERWSRLKRDQCAPERAVPTTPAAEEAPAKPSAHAHSSLAASDAELELEADVKSNAKPGVTTDVETDIETAGESPTKPVPGSLDHTLPDPETLDAGSDFKAFMAPGVSGALRRKALKRLWATGNYNVRDGLDDYDADYRQQLKPMANELASQLRRWTHKAKDATDKYRDNASDGQQGPSTNDHDNARPVAQDKAAPTPYPPRNGHALEKASLDDQSDAKVDSHDNV